MKEYDHVILLMISTWLIVWSYRHSCHWPWITHETTSKSRPQNSLLQAFHLHHHIASLGSTHLPILWKSITSATTRKCVAITYAHLYSNLDPWLASSTVAKGTLMMEKDGTLTVGRWREWMTCKGAWSKGMMTSDRRRVQLPAFLIKPLRKRI